MKYFEWLSKKEAESLTMSQYLSAARRTLEEAHAKRSHLESNPPASDALRTTSWDRDLLKGMMIRVKADQDDQSACTPGEGWDG
jgi:hypothetical protein